MYQLEYIFHHLRPFYGGGVHGNAPAPLTTGAKLGEIFLTEQERLKEEMLSNGMMMAEQQLTTPKGLAEMMKSFMKNED